MADNTTIDELKAPLLAALGAADLALATVNDLLIELRDRAAKVALPRVVLGQMLMLKELLAERSVGLSRDLV